MIFNPLTPPPSILPISGDSNSFNNYAYPMLQWTTAHGNECIVIEKNISYLELLRDGNNVGMSRSPKNNNWMIPQGVGVNNITAFYTAYSFSLIANNIYFAPLYVRNKIDITQILININTSADAQLYVGIYSDNGGAPYLPLLTSPSISTSTTGIKTASISTTTLMPSSIYWVTFVVTGGSPKIYGTNSSYLAIDLGIDAPSIGISSVYSYYTLSQTFTGIFPSSPTGLVKTKSSNSAIPSIAIIGTSY